MKVEAALPKSVSKADVNDARFYLQTSKVSKESVKSITLRVYKIGIASVVKNLFMNSKKAIKAVVACSVDSDSREETFETFICVNSAKPTLVLEGSKKGIAVSFSIAWNISVCGYTKGAGFYTTNMSSVTLPMQSNEKAFSDYAKAAKYINTTVTMFGYKLKNPYNTEVMLEKEVETYQQSRLNIGGGKFEIQGISLLKVVALFQDSLIAYISHIKATTESKPLAEATAILMKNSDRVKVTRKKKVNKRDLV